MRLPAPSTARIQSRASPESQISLRAPPCCWCMLRSSLVPSPRCHAKHQDSHSRRSRCVRRHRDGYAIASARCMRGSVRNQFWTRCTQALISGVNHLSRSAGKVRTIFNLCFEQIHTSPRILFGIMSTWSTILYGPTEPLARKAMLDPASAGSRGGDGRSYQDRAFTSASVVTISSRS